MYKLYYFFLVTLIDVTVEDEFLLGHCSADRTCSRESLLPRYVLYDVNRPEGFNLRRDVYMRMAIFIQDYAKKMNQDVHLVLPPWDSLYHWQSSVEEAGHQSQLFWNNFFDVQSIKKFAPVLEMYDFFKETKNSMIDHVFVLQHYKDLFDHEDGQIEWKLRWKNDICHQQDFAWHFRKLENGNFEVKLWGYNNITAKDVKCLSFQGEASLLTEILNHFNSRIVIIDHAEIPLHHNFGDSTYWKCRRSMRFNNGLVELATNFRKQYLNSNNIADNTVRPNDWRLEKEQRNAIGGPYLAVHLRRKDFLIGRKNQVPSLEEAAKQITMILFKLNLNAVFVATDATLSEFSKLENLLTDFSVFRYEPSKGVKLKYKDGGVAIIDQIICSHARYFIGSHESTFSFRIQEEREILGFDPDSTFNCFCVTIKTKCHQPTRWKIVY